MCKACDRSLAEWAKRDERDQRSFKGVHVVKKALKDGTVGAYFYAWRGGPLFAGHGSDVHFPSRKFEAKFEVVRARKPKALTHKPDTIRDLIALYRQMPGPKSQKKAFRHLKPTTKASYDLHLTRINDKWGSVPVHLITEKSVPGFRSKIVDWIETLKKEHGVPSAAYTVKVMSLVFTHAIYHGKLSKAAHPTEDIPLGYDGGNRPEKLWNDDREVAFYRLAPAYISRGLFLACWTGQRQADIVNMRFGQGEQGQPFYDPETKWVHLNQEKTGVLVSFPAPAVLREKLDAEWKRRQAEGITEVRLLLTSAGKPWSNAHSFGAKFIKIKQALDSGAFRDLHYHDARGTAATRFALADVPLTQIAAITGHKETSIRTLVERYLGGRRDLAKKAMDKAHEDQQYLQRMRRIGSEFNWAA